MQGLGNDGAARRQDVPVGAVIDALGFPAAVIDGSKKILRCNRLFADLLATRAGDRMWRRLQVVADPAAGPHFALDAGDGTVGPRIAGLRALGGCDRKAFLVTVSADPPDPGTGGSPTLRGDITAAEQAVLFGMLAGRPLAEIARERGTKVSTVRWHLKNIQSKLRAADKAEVVAWIARSPVCWLAPE
jgi:DNA-binding CsgD family transcriptional regulator